MSKLKTYVSDFNVKKRAQFQSTINLSTSIVAICIKVYHSKS